MYSRDESRLRSRGGKSPADIPLQVLVSPHNLDLRCSVSYPFVFYGHHTERGTEKAMSLMT